MKSTDYADNQALLANTLKPNAYYLVWHKQQKALSSMWMQIKQSFYVLKKTKPSPI